MCRIHVLHTCGKVGSTIALWTKQTFTHRTEPEESDRTVSEEATPACSRPPCGRAGSTMHSSPPNRRRSPATGDRDSAQRVGVGGGLLLSPASRRDALAPRRLRTRPYGDFCARPSLASGDSHGAAPDDIMAQRHVQQVDGRHDPVVVLPKLLHPGVTLCIAARSDPRRRTPSPVRRPRTVGRFRPQGSHVSAPPGPVPGSRKVRRSGS